jgi:hypothetical protein
VLGVTEPRIEDDLDLDVALATFDAPVHLVDARSRIVRPRHVICEPHGAVTGDVEQGLQHVRIWIVALEALVRPGNGRQCGEATALVVKDGREDAGAVETGQAQPVDGAVHAHQRTRGAVPDQPVRAER